ncbi:MAG: hypothetical protein V4736_09035 [Bdellovibrionota bacterium]
MKFSKNGSVICIALALTVSAYGGKKTLPNDWRARMQTLLGDVVVMFPFAYDQELYTNKDNAVFIKDSLASLKKHSSSLNDHLRNFSDRKGAAVDPILPYIADEFAEELKLAESKFNEGGSSLKQSQVYLQSALNKCIQCHTQTSKGRELNFGKFSDQYADLKPVSRFYSLVVTRQFSESLKQFDEIIASSNSKKQSPGSLDQVGRTALAIAVRVKEDPKLTLKILNAMEENETGTSAFRSDVKGWKNASILWQTETAAPPKKDSEMLSKAKELVQQGKKSETLSNFQSGSVSYLRAVTYLHKLIEQFPQSKLKPEAYLLLASTYELLPGFALWDVSEHYLTSCIVENPHSEIGEKCFAEYEDQTTMGYTGTAGTFIPGPVIEHINRMKKLSAREKK